MPLSEGFKQLLRDVYTDLGSAQRGLAALKDEAEFDGLPNQVVSTLARKESSLHYMREDLKEIPKRVAETERRREAARQ